MRPSGDTRKDPFAVLDSLSGTRRKSVATLINLIAARGPLSRSQAMENLGWSRSRITQVATTLLDAKVLAETVVVSDDRGRGRPAALLRLVVDNTATIGIDLGFRSIRMILARVDHHILQADERQLSDSYGPDEAFAAIDDMIGGGMKAHCLKWADVVGAGIAISGPIDYQRNEPSLDSLQPFWSGDVVKRAARHLSCPIILGNDTRLACYAELLWGAGREFSDFVYLKLHSGTGGAFVANGQMVMGATGSAGEVGHMVVKSDGDRCRCGGYGCLETLIGVPALLRELSQSHGAPVQWAEAVAALRAGDAAAVQVFGHAFDVIGRASASLCNVLNPQAIVLGGALTRAFAEADRRVAGGIAEHALPSCARTPVLIGSLGREAAALGAVGAVLMRGIV